MSYSPSDPGNPYQSPAEEAVVVSLASPANLRLLKLLRDFRSQIVAIGAFWIFIGGLTLAVGGSIAGGLVMLEDSILLATVLVGVGVVWVSLGALVCLKQIWALYTALTLSYLSAIGNVINLNLCALALLIAVILQAHRVLGFANELKRAGIPLTTKPHELKIQLQSPM